MNSAGNMSLVPFDLLTHIYKDNFSVVRRSILLLTQRFTHLGWSPLRHLFASLPHNFAGCLTHIKSPLNAVMLTKLINLLLFSSKQRLPAHLLFVKDCCVLVGANKLSAYSKEITGGEGQIFPCCR